DGIRDFHVTGVQTCALPIFRVDSARNQRVDLVVFRVAPRHAVETIRVFGAADSRAPESIRVAYRGKGLGAVGEQSEIEIVRGEEAACRVVPEQDSGAGRDDLRA